MPARETDPMESAASPVTVKVTLNVSLHATLQPNAPENARLEKVLVVVTVAITLSHIKPSAEVPFGRMNGELTTCTRLPGALIDVMLIVIGVAEAGMHADAKSTATARFRLREFVGIFP